MSEKLEDEKKVRTALRKTLTRKLNELNALLEKDTCDVDEVIVLKDLLQERMDDLSAVDKRIFEILVGDGVDEDALTAEVEACDEYAMKHRRLRQRCERLLEMPKDYGSQYGSEKSGSKVSGQSGAGSEDTQRRKFKLPRIEFRPFSGEIRDWLSFWSQFEKIHDDAEIDKADKMLYLIQATTPNSRARRLVESYPATGRNYEKVIDALKARFGREDLQIEVYIRDFLKLIIKSNMRKNIDVAALYDQIETYMRALETMGVMSDKYAAILYPMVESCLPEELLRCAQRARDINDIEKEDKVEKRLEKLMLFLRNEVDSEQRISLAKEGLGLCEKGKQKMNATIVAEQVDHLPTAASLLTETKVTCIFCQKNHPSEKCFSVTKMTYAEKRDAVVKAGSCFKCLKGGHRARYCKAKVCCKKCDKGHFTFMCNSERSESTEATQNLSNTSYPNVFLQTVRVNVDNGHGKKKNVRLLFDSGSQRSYILKSTAEQLRLNPIRSETLAHSLFGGSVSNQTKHNCFEVVLEKGENKHRVEVLEVTKICNRIAPVYKGPWSKELSTLGIELSDVYRDDPIEILIGADSMGVILTSERFLLQCGLVASKTAFGWTLMGKTVTQQPKENHVMMYHSMLLSSFKVEQLWELEVLGIEEPRARKEKEAKALETKQVFLESVKRDEDGRYVVCLPWISDHPELPSNRDLAESRLRLKLKSLKKNIGLFDEYDAVFENWRNEGIISELSNVKDDSGHFLPHRPVVKEESTTTKVRPVFDASARFNGRPALNDCLETGPNLIELLPKILLKFRLNKIGIIADIKKAFLQIKIQERDRNVLKFLWVDRKDNLRIFRHNRVVFGINCSPFLLGATLEHHLNSFCAEGQTEPEDSKVAEILKQSFYVDNCVVSVPTMESANNFIERATAIMNMGKFELRGWERSGEGDEKVLVLGIWWNKVKDVLSLNLRNLNYDIDSILTKKIMLSTIQRVFDPLGMVTPVLVKPKIMLQNLWKEKVKWEEPLDSVIKQDFDNWYKELKLLEEIEIPRWMNVEEGAKISIHIFCDASKDAYATVGYLRSEQPERVNVSLLFSKARLAPIKKLSIPRLELMAANIASRMYDTLKCSLPVFTNVMFWSDSTTVLAWIRRSVEWAPFVGNRVKEIRELTSPHTWRYVPTNMNPADLPSRGCPISQLKISRWWEGPEWLRSGSWPTEEDPCNEEEVNLETKKRSVQVLTVTADENWDYFSKFLKNLRTVAWVQRFSFNSKRPKERRTGELTSAEIDEASIKLWRIIQQRSFCGGEADTRLQHLRVFKDENDILRLKSIVCRREDATDFRFPIVLPGDQELVKRMLYDLHVKLCHVGASGLLSAVREQFWILGGRRAIRSVISKCVICKRHSAKAVTVEAADLPKDRVREAIPFEVSGIDFAGPLTLRDGSKVWICLFTCAVYRAVHLELVSSLSTAAFLQALRRFIARRGRPKKVYTDNGTNFVGAANSLRRIDWEDVLRFSSGERLEWCFNPPAAPWWGGFWERLILEMKRLLKKVLGRASLTYEELATILCDCEAILNNRPITFVSSDANDIVALTPNMFLREAAGEGTPDCDLIDINLAGRAAYLQKLRFGFRKRFRNEYLGYLSTSKRKKNSTSVKVGEIVLLGDEQTKRIEWPLARVEEVFPGADGKIRVVKVRTSKGFLIRPVQRLYPLECEKLQEDKVTSEETLPRRSVRVTRKPDRLTYS